MEWLRFYVQEYNFFVLLFLLLFSTEVFISELKNETVGVGESATFICQVNRTLNHEQYNFEFTYKRTTDIAPITIRNGNSFK